MRFKKGILTLLLLFAALLLISCNDDSFRIVQQGIVIEQDGPAVVPEELQQRAEAVVYDLMKAYYEKTVSLTLPEKTLEKIRTESKKITALTQNHVLTQGQYAELIACVESNMQSILSYMSNPTTDMAQIKALYRALSAASDPDYVGDTLYEILSYAYDYKYRECMERYENYGYAFLLTDAQMYLNEKALLEAEVGRDGFIDATKTFFFFAELFEKGVAEEGMLSSFTDEELLVLIQNINLGMEGVTPKGFALLLSYIPSSAEGGYFSRFLHKAKENGDIALIASNAQDTLRLFALCQEKMEADDCHYVREGDMEGLLSAVATKFDDAAWAVFATVTSVELHNADYDQVATAMFGEAYTAYLANVETSTWDALRQSAGAPDFAKALKGYVAGICPALVYGISYD